jgi:hypothetical protein
MDILNNIIELMSKEELRNYKLLAERSHSGDRKDIELLDYIRKSGPKFKERLIVKRLYGTGGKNSYYRLKNRLLDEVGKSQVLLHWDHSEFNSALHYLVLAVLYREKQQFKVALYFIRRAEKISKQIGKPELLDLIYGEMIALSFELIEVNPESYIHLRTENLQTLNRLREIDNILAAVSYRIKVSQNFGEQDDSILDLLEKTVQEYSNDSGLNANPQYRFRMYHAVSKILIQKRDYTSLEAYLLKTFEEFSRDQLFNRNNHDTKLQMLTYLINALNKTGKVHDSLDWTARLLEGMKEYNRLHYEKYLFFFFNSQAINYSKIDMERAVRILEEMLQNGTLIKIPVQVVYIHLNLALFQYELRQYKPAIRTLIRLTLLEAFSSTDAAMRLPITLFELAVRFELQEFDVLEYRLTQCRNDFKTLLETTANQKENNLLNLMVAMAKSNDYRNDDTVKKLGQSFVSTYESDDTEIFKFGEWVQSHLQLKTI